MGDNGYPKGADTTQLKACIQNADSVTDAFKGQMSSSAINILMEQAKEFVDNTFRLDIPDNAAGLCIALSLQRCEENNYTEGILFWKICLGLIAAKHAKRAELAVDAIVGERRWKEGMKNKGAMDKFKEWASGG